MANNNYLDLFREEQTIWVKSLVPGQVSCTFETGPGMQRSVLVPYSGDPIRLTDEIPFDAIKRCMDLRKLCNPRRMNNGQLKPPALALLTDAQANEHFRAKALRKGMFVKDAAGQPIRDAAGAMIPDVEAAQAPVYTAPAVTVPTRVVADRDSTAAANNEPSDYANLGAKPVMMADEIHPRVLQLCHEVATAQDDNQRPLADALRDEFDRLGDLTEASLNHILGFGYYKSIKTWAQQQLAAKAGAGAE